DVAVEVGKVSGEAAPKRILRRFGDDAARRLRLPEYFAHVFFLANIVRQRHARKTAAGTGNKRVGSQIFNRKKRQPGAFHGKENDAFVFLIGGQAEPVAIKSGGAFQIGNAERNNADSWFHAGFI